MPYHFFVGTFTCSLDVASWLSHGFDSHQCQILFVVFLLRWFESQGHRLFLIGTPSPVVFAGVISSGLSLGFSLLSQVESRSCSTSVGRTSVSPGVPVDFSLAF